MKDCKFVTKAVNGRVLLAHAPAFSSKQALRWFQNLKYSKS